MATLEKGPPNNFQPNWSAAPAGEASPPPKRSENVSFNLPAEQPPKEGRVAAAMAAATDAKARGGLDAPLQPMTSKEGEGKLKRAMRSVRGRLTSPSIRDAKARLGKAAKATRRLLVTGNYAGEIIVAGERVRLEERGFDPRKFYDVVSFHDKFFPAKDIQDLSGEKAVFGQVFGDGAPLDPGTGAPSLPCNGREADTLFEGLKTRFDDLRAETVKLHEMVGDTTEVRERIDHLQRLKIFIDALERSRVNGTCVDFRDLATVTGKDVRTEEEIRALLRQFAFMILQARAPVSEYSDRTRIVQEFIQELQRDPVSEEEMNAYLVLWKEQAEARGTPEALPTILGEVLDTTATQRGLLDMMLEDKLDALYQQILQVVRADYQVNGALLEKFNRLILERISPNEASMSPQEKVIEAIKIVLSMNKDCWEQFKEADTKAASLQAEKEKLLTEQAALQTELEACRGMHAGEMSEMQKLNEQITTLSGETAEQKAQLAAQAAAAEEAAKSAAAKIEQLTGRYEVSGRIINQQAAQLDAALKYAKEKEAEAIAALAAQDNLRENLQILDAEHQELNRRYELLKSEQGELLKKHVSIEADLKGAQAEVARLETGAAGSVKEAADRAGELAALKQQVGRLTSEKGGIEKELEDCHTKMEMLQGRVRTMGEETATAKAEAATAAAAAEAEAKAAAANAAEATGRAELAETAARGFQETLQRLEAEVAAARQQAAAAAAEAARLQGEAAAGSSKAAAAVAAATAAAAAAATAAAVKIEALENAKEAAEAAKLERDADVQRLQEELSSAKAAIAAQEATVAEATATAKKLREELEVARAKAATDLEGANGAAAQQVAELQKRLKELEAGIEARQAALDQAKRDCEEKLETIKKTHGSQIQTLQRETATAQGALETQTRDLLKHLQDLAASVEVGTPTAPAGVKNPTLATGFTDLLAKMDAANKKASADAFASGAVSNPDIRFNVSTQVCFMTHFITFFVKTLFFTHDRSAERYALLDTLDNYVSQLLTDYRGAFPQEGGDEKHILFELLSTTFGLLYAGETLYMNKQSVSGAPPFNGLLVLKEDKDGKPDAARATRVQLLYDIWKGVPDHAGAQSKVRAAVETVFGQILLHVPTVHFNPPIDKKGGTVTTADLQLLHDYPSMTFLPLGSTKEMSPQKFTVVDIDNGFAMSQRNIFTTGAPGVLGDKAAGIAWPAAVREVIDDDGRTYADIVKGSKSNGGKLTFADLFCIFVALGRRYLMSIKLDLLRFKCPLPAFLADPAAAKAALEEDRKLGKPMTGRERLDSMGAAATKAAEAAAAPQLRATQWGRGNNLSRPVLEGGGTASNPQTLAIIFRQLKSGSTIIKDALSADLKDYSDSEYFALKAFLDAYRMHSQYFKSEPAGSPDDITHIKRWMGSVIDALAKSPRAGITNAEFLRKFLLFLIDSYIRQYRVEGADTPQEKIAALLPELEACLDVPMRDHPTKDMSLFTYAELKRNGRFVIFVEPFLLSGDAFEQKYKTGFTAQLSKNFKEENGKIVYKSR